MTDREEFDAPDEYPSQDELPDDPPNPENIDPFTLDPDNFDDVNEFSAAEWVATTSPEERVRKTAQRLDESASMQEIASAAKASENHAQTVLDRLSTHTDPISTDAMLRNLIADIVGHPDGAPCLEELDYMNPKMSVEDIKTHLQQLIAEGTVRVLDDDLTNDDIEEPPEYFYALTEAARDRFDATGQFPRGAWRREYDSVQKPSRIQSLEALPRPQTD